MKRRMTRLWIFLATIGLAWQCLPTGAALADDHGWAGKRRISAQDPKDLFYNYYVGPEPSGTAAQIYVSPLPVPESVGHTYTTYQPLMPHELMYGHHRSWYTHHPGAGWTRTKVRYSAVGNKLQFLKFKYR